MDSDTIHVTPPAVTFNRSSNGDEIDLIIDRKQTRELIEIKAGETFTPRMTKEIEKFNDQNTTGYLLYRGQTITYLPNVHVLNYQEYLDSKLPHNRLNYLD